MLDTWPKHLAAELADQILRRLAYGTGPDYRERVAREVGEELAAHLADAVGRSLCDRLADAHGMARPRADGLAVHLARALAVALGRLSPELGRWPASPTDLAEVARQADQEAERLAALMPSLAQVDAALRVLRLPGDEENTDRVRQALRAAGIVALPSR